MVVCVSSNAINDPQSSSTGNDSTAVNAYDLLSCFVSGRIWLDLVRTCHVRSLCCLEYIRSTWG